MKNRSGRVLLIAALVVGIGLVAWLLQPRTPAPEVGESGPRIPATDPPLEPGRPDLIGEPRVADAAAESDSEQGL